jgi:hypothetical protein
VHGKQPAFATILIAAFARIHWAAGTFYQFFNIKAASKWL